MPRKTTKKQRVLNYAAERGWTHIGGAEWQELRQALPDISASTIQQCGLPVDPPWCGIRQHTFQDLEASLREFSEAYESKPELRRLCRDQVIAAKDRAKWLSVSSRSDEETRRRKAQMAEWMLVWLGDPSVFPVWADALRAANGNAGE